MYRDLTSSIALNRIEREKMHQLRMPRRASVAQKQASEEALRLLLAIQQLSLVQLNR
jgi:hypothetical protein